MKKLFLSSGAFGCSGLKVKVFMEKVLVFCGSNTGSNPRYNEEAAALGKALVQRDIELIYGGAKVGLMGTLADAVLKAGGKATGVIPKFLQAKEVAHGGLTSLVCVDTLQERKAKMSELCDGVIALPGGYGTMDELFEMLTWAQLGLHFKPVGLLNTENFYDPLLAMISKMREDKFLKKMHADILLVSSQVDDLLDRMEKYTAPTGSKWM